MVELIMKKIPIIRIVSGAKTARRVSLVWYVTLGERESGGGGTLADAIIFPGLFSSLFKVSEIRGISSCADD